MVGDLLNAHSGILEQGLGFEDHRLVDPPRGGLAAHLLHHGREVFGRDIELLGVEAHVALPLVVLLQQRHELVEQHLAAPLLHLAGLLALVDLGDDVERRGEERADDLVAVTLLVAAQHGLDELEQLADFVHVLRRDLQHGGLAEAHIDRQRGREVDLDLVDERFREGQQVGRGVRRTLDCADDRIGVEKDDRVGLDAVILHVDRHGGLARHHNDGRKAVDRGWIIGRGVLVGRECGNHQIVRKVKDVTHLLLDPGDGDLAQTFASSAARRFAVIRHIVVIFPTKV